MSLEDPFGRPTLPSLRQEGLGVRRSIAAAGGHHAAAELRGLDATCAAAAFRAFLEVLQAVAGENSFVFNSFEEFWRKQTQTPVVLNNKRKR